MRQNDADSITNCVDLDQTAIIGTGVVALLIAYPLSASGHEIDPPVQLILLWKSYSLFH